MAMRYLIRRNKPEQVAELKKEIPDLEKQLGAPAADLRRYIRVPFSTMRHAHYTFITKKSGEAWVWSCTSIELVAEDESGLFALTERYNVPKPSHLAHLSP